MAEIIDRQFTRAAIYCGIAAGLTWFGVIHSPLPGDKMLLPWRDLTDPAHLRMVAEMATVYTIMAGILWGIGRLTRGVNRPIESDEEFEAIEAQVAD